MEVSMLKTRRYTPQFDALEGKLLLSTGSAHPATHRQPPKHIGLTGTLKGLPSGFVGPKGFTVTSFVVSGHAGSMGNVIGPVELADPIIRVGRLPDLSNARLILSNDNGSVVLELAVTKRNRHHFKIVGGTGKDVRAVGVGSAKVTSARNSFNFTFTLYS
jgi:hypothetical protein